MTRSAEIEREAARKLRDSAERERELVNRGYQLGCSEYGADPNKTEMYPEAIDKAIATVDATHPRPELIAQGAYVCEVCGARHVGLHLERCGKRVCVDCYDGPTIIVNDSPRSELADSKLVPSELRIWTRRLLDSWWESARDTRDATIDGVLAEVGPPPTEPLRHSLRLLQIAVQEFHQSVQIAIYVHQRIPQFL